MNCNATHYRPILLFFGLWLAAGFWLTAKAQSTGPLPDARITVSVQDGSLADLLQHIEKVSSYTFTYNKVDAERLSIGTATWKDTPLKTILIYVKEKFRVTYIVAGSNIAVKFPAKGRIAGQVLEAGAGTPVAGATVSAGGQSAIADAEGNYVLPVAAGTYNIEISSVGYQRKKVTDVAVSGTETTLLNLTLTVNSGRLEEVLVTTSVKRETVNALYARQKNAPAISDGISAEQMGRTPDKNIGESLKRISGVSVMDNRYVVVRGLSERYNQAILNGQIMPSTELNRKQFSFDIIPSNLVDNVIVYKTITSDQSAEFGGGSVEVNTRSIPTENFLTVTAGSSYNDQTTGKAFRSPEIERREFFALPARHRYLFGSLDWKNTREIAAKYESLNKAAGSFSNNWGLYDRTAPPSQNYQVSFGRVLPMNNAQKIGVIASLSYRNTFQTQQVRMTRDGFEGVLPGSEDVVAFTGRSFGLTTNIGGLAGIGYSDKTSKISLQALYLHTLDQQFILGSGGHADPGGFFLGYYDLATYTALWQNQLKGEHLIGKKGVRLSWSGSYLHLDKQRPDNHTLKGDLLQDIDVTTSDEYNIRNPMSSAGGPLRWWTRANEKNLFWDADIAVPFKFALGKTAVSNTFKTGYAGWNKDRLFFVLNTYSGPGINSEYYPPLNMTFDTSRGGGVAISRFGDDFDRNASLHAGFLMFDHKIGKNWRLVWGARGEYYNLNKVNAALDSLFREINAGRGGNNQFNYTNIKTREKDWNFFPSFNLTYSLTPQMNLRVAYAKSIIRPDLREMSFFNEYDFELGGTYNSQVVRSTILHHYDFRYEWYPGPGEVVSFSLFYKKIHYPMEIYQEANHQFMIRNNKAAENRGLEVELRKSFAFTKVPVLKNFTLYGNFTMLRGKVSPMIVNYNVLDPIDELTILPQENIGPEEKRLQTGASNYIINGGLYYDTRPVSLSLSYNYITNRMYRPTVVYAESLYERPMQALDAQAAVRFLKQRLELKLNVGNLLNSYPLVYMNNYDYAVVGTDAQIPPVKDLLYQRSKDEVDYESRPGRTYSATITYRF